MYLLSPDVNVKMSNNLFAVTVDQVRFVDASRENYRLKANSPAVNDGHDISRYEIKQDFYLSTRLKGQTVDIGASEY